MRNRIVVGLVALLLSLGGFIGASVKPAFATGSCNGVTACYARDDWYLSVGSGVLGGEVKMKVCDMSETGTNGGAAKFWLTMVNGNTVQGSLTHTAGGSLQMQAAWVDFGGTSHVVTGPTASLSHWYYIKITRASPTSQSWNLNFYDGNTLSLLWSPSFTLDTGTNARELDTGLSTTNSAIQAQAGQRELQFLNTSSTWVSGWGTATNPGTFTGFYKGTDNALADVGWVSAYTTLSDSFFDALACQA